VVGLLLVAARYLAFQFEFGGLDVVGGQLMIAEPSDAAISERFLLGFLWFEGM
jgi:hypothetical protein